MQERHMTMDSIEIRQPELHELIQVQQLRHAVLDTARLVNTDHRLGQEDFRQENIHMAAFVLKNIVGTVRLDLIETTPTLYEVRKMAVEQTVRHKGIGKHVLEAALIEARSRGADGFRLDARIEAIPFFEKIGFKLTGEQISHNDGVLNYGMVRLEATQ